MTHLLRSESLNVVLSKEASKSKDKRVSIKLDERSKNQGDSDSVSVKDKPTRGLKGNPLSDLSSSL